MGERNKRRIRKWPQRRLVPGIVDDGKVSPPLAEFV
jgi:hypothetical protein